MTGRPGMTDAGRGSWSPSPIRPRCAMPIESSQPPPAWRAAIRCETARLIAGCGPGTAGPEVRRAVLAVAWGALDSCPRPRPDAWAPGGATGRYREILASRPGGWPNGWMRLEFLGTVVRSIEMAQGE